MPAHGFFIVGGLWYQPANKRAYIAAMKVIYFTPAAGIYIGELEAMPSDELLCLAKNCNDAIIYDSPSDFQEAFNNDEVSDLGYIFFINK